MRDHLDLTQVLMLSEPGNFSETGPALWAMLEEAVAIFNVAGEVVAPRRWCVTPEPVPALHAVTAEHERLVLERSQMERLFVSSSGTFEQTLDAGALADRVKDLLAEHGERPASLLLVTDQEITPPSYWRYILWDGGPGWGVVSIAPMDPAYWGISAEDRTREIKRRARAASICHIGSRLGLQRCKNPRCYLFGNVDSVLRLDRMTTIGEEHPEFPRGEAIGYGNSDRADPAALEPLLGPAELTAEEWAP